MMIGTASAVLAAPWAGLAMHRVAGRDDWARVRALRYESLSSRGDIVPSAERIHSDSHDLTLSCSTFLLLKHGRAIGSTRASFSASQRRCSLPASATFQREMASAIAIDARVVEASLTVTDPHEARDRRTVLLHLLKAHMVVCAVERADWLIAAVRDDEIGFYRRMLNMEILSGVERCPGTATPQVLMGLQYREHAALLFGRIPVLAVNTGDEKEYAATGCVHFAIDAQRHQAA
jgi:hypothetical protein